MHQWIPFHNIKIHSVGFAWKQFIYLQCVSVYILCVCFCCFECVYVFVVRLCMFGPRVNVHTCQPLSFFSICFISGSSGRRCLSGQSVARLITNAHFYYKCNDVKVKRIHNKFLLRFFFYFFCCRLSDVTWVCVSVCQCVCFVPSKKKKRELGASATTRILRYQHTHRDHIHLLSNRISGICGVAWQTTLDSQPQNTLNKQSSDQANIVWSPLLNCISNSVRGKFVIVTVWFACVICAPLLTDKSMQRDGAWH